MFLEHCNVPGTCLILLGRLTLEVKEESRAASNHENYINSDWWRCTDEEILELPDS